MHGTHTSSDNLHVQITGRDLEPYILQPKRSALLTMQVLEAWPQWAGGLTANPQFHTAILRFLDVLANSLHSARARRTHKPLVLALMTLSMHFWR